MEIRKDYILNRFVIIAPKRGKRPFDFKQPVIKTESKDCSFCPGSEDQTPPEIGRVKKDGKWILRWFPNKFGFVEQLGEKRLRTDNKFYTFSDAYGKHEVLVETPNHNSQLHDLDISEIKGILKVYSERIKDLSNGYEYVVIFKNYGIEAGTSLVHSHTQIVALEITPPYILEEADSSFENGKCKYCEIIGREKDSHRRVFENDSFISFCPYASRFNFEVWIFPKKHINNITEMEEVQLYDLASMLKQILGKLSELNASYNLVLHYAPKEKNLHFHIEVMPRIAKFGGFEFASNIIVNQVSPEDAAKFYRD